jgi:polyisoprenoid-binding protein YceI
MRLVIAAAASLALALPAAAQSVDVPTGTYESDPTHTSIAWKVSHLGFSDYTGFFARGAVEAVVELDAENVANSTLAVTLQGDEVRTLHPIDLDPRNVDFDEEIASDMFLGTLGMPVVTFRSTGIEVTGENTAIITGDLTIGETTRPLELDTTLNRAANHPVTGMPTLGISATGVVTRSEYGIDTLVGPVGDDVTLEIEAELVHQQ